MNLRLIAVCFLFSGLLGCQHEPQVTPATGCPQISFSTQVNPIIQQNCAIASCHVAGFPDGDFTQFDELKEKVDNGSFKNSVIDWSVPRMPETYKLPESQISTLKCWIEQGAQKN